jgi:large subunit ribosomal protein L17
MRHNKKFNHLGRTSSHRKALLANMASSLIASKRISTTVAKAKALRTYVEPLITKAKDDSTHARRVVFSQLQDKNAVSELFREVADKVGDRPGGYTRILRTGNRLGDNAEMCIIELVDYNEAMLSSADDAAKSKKRRSRRGGSKKAGAVVAEAEKQVKTKAVKAAPVSTAVKEVEPQAQVSAEVVSDAEVAGNELNDEAATESTEEKEA